MDMIKEYPKYLRKLESDSYARCIGRGCPLRIANTLRDHELNESQCEAWAAIRETLRRGEIAILHGPFGIGKSTVAGYFIWTCVCKKRSCSMRTVAGLMASQKNWFNSYQTGNPSPIDTAKKTYFLVLDELAVEGTEYDKSTLTDIIKHRYDNNLPTLIVTNVAPQYHAKALTGAVMDRVKDGAVVGMTGESMRGKNNG